MLKSLACLATVLQMLYTGVSDSSFRTTAAMKTGILLRLHVVAQDDTIEMQTLKLLVRDDVRAAYAAQPRDPRDTMLTHTEKILPILAQAAQDSALAHGFTQPVSVLLGWFEFDQHEEDGLIIPAGRYPALVVRLGEAQGHNWWGLIDPSAALNAASFGDPASSFFWDWSFSGFLAALMNIPFPAGDAHA